MNLTILQLQIVTVETPSVEPCGVAAALGDLAARLRQEMQFGRDCGCGPIDLPGVTVGMAVAFQNYPERN